MRTVASAGKFSSARKRAWVFFSFEMRSTSSACLFGMFSFEQVLDGDPWH